MVLLWQVRALLFRICFLFLCAHSTIETNATHHAEKRHSPGKNKFTTQLPTTKTTGKRACSSSSACSANVRCSRLSISSPTSQVTPETSSKIGKARNKEINCSLEFVARGSSATVFCLSFTLRRTCKLTNDNFKWCGEKTHGKGTERKFTKICDDDCLFLFCLRRKRAAEHSMSSLRQWRIRNYNEAHLKAIR